MQIINVSLAKAYKNVNSPTNSKIPYNSLTFLSKLNSPDIPWFSRMWEPCFLFGCRTILATNRESNQICQSELQYSVQILTHTQKLTGSGPSLPHEISRENYPEITTGNRWARETTKLRLLHTKVSKYWATANFLVRTFTSQKNVSV